MSEKLDPKAVEIFLLENLDFFETRESLLSEMNFKHLKLREEHKNIIELLKSYIDTASINEDLFNKSKDLTLKILESSSNKKVINKVNESFKKDFNVDKCLLEFFDNKQIDEIEKKTELSMHKGAIHCGSFSNEKMSYLFNGDEKIESLVIAVIVLQEEIGLLKLGSYDRTKYLGDEDTTFIEYIRDVLEKKLMK